jgi:hypothetical protein
VGLGGIGLELDGVAVGLLRLLVPALAAQGIPQVVVGQRKIGLELDGVAVGLLRFLYPSTAFFSSLSTPRPSAYSSPSSFIA